MGNLKQLLDWYVENEFLVAVPNGSLTLYDYTNRCALMGNWNWHTTQARGLVLDEQGNRVSIPLPKFFNLDEQQGSYLKDLPNEEPEIAEKLDGSLVIIFQHPKNQQWVATTRRSWRNDQTWAAYQWLIDNSNKLEPGYTYCFELIAPWNKVVVDYPEEKLILIARTDKYGQDCSYQELADFGKKQGLETASFRVGRLNLLDPGEFPENTEGYVVRFSNGKRVKIKGTWYLEKHKNVC